MNYGLMVSASGVLTSLYRQDVAANNLANVDTVGFKPDAVATRQRDSARVEDGLLSMPSNRLLERLGGGVLMAPNQTRFTQGAIEKTGNELDLAINGDGFFVVSGGGAGGPDGGRLRLTRDGRMTIDARGRLVLAGEGLPVLDTSDRPITVNPGAALKINGDGTVMQNGAAIAKIQVTDIPDRRALRKVGAGLFAASEGAIAARAPATGTIAPGAIERSGVDPIRAMMDVSNATQDVTANARMVQLHDDLMNRAINTLGRVT